MAWTWAHLLFVESALDRVVLAVAKPFLEVLGIGRERLPVSMHQPPEPILIVGEIEALAHSSRVVKQAKLPVVGQFEILPVSSTGSKAILGVKEPSETNMPKGPQGQRRPADTVANAIRVAKILTGEVEEDMSDSGKDRAAQALGRKGGAARRDKLSPERRSEIARKAAAKRWGKGGSE